MPGLDSNEDLIVRASPPSSCIAPSTLALEFESPTLEFDSRPVRVSLSSRFGNAALDFQYAWFFMRFEYDAASVQTARVNVFKYLSDEPLGGAYTLAFNGVRPNAFRPEVFEKHDCHA